MTKEDVRPGADLSPRALLVALLLALTLFYGNLAKESYMDDYRAFYVASVAVHDGLDPYVNHVDVSEKYADALWLRADSRFIYPPTALLFVGPLRVLSYKWSKTVFGLAMTLVMVGILLGFQRRYPRQTPILLALFLTLPMFMNIDNGNCDVLVLGLVLGAFWLDAGSDEKQIPSGDDSKKGNGKGGVAGVLLGVAVAIKFAPVLVGIWFVANRRWRVVVWSAVTVGVLTAAAWWRFGAGYFQEFWVHLKRHGDAGTPMVTHVFETVHKIQNQVIVTADGVFDYQHDVGGYMQNPLRFLGNAGGVIGLTLLVGFVLWAVLSKRGRGLRPEQSFAICLVMWLLANPLLWAMGLVACFPLIVLLVASSKVPNRAAVLLLVPMALTKQVIGEQNFALWLVCAGWCLWRSGWLGKVEDGVLPHGPAARGAVTGPSARPS